MTCQTRPGFAASLLLVFAAVSAGLAAGQAAPENAEARKIANPVPASAESISRGEQLFQKNCSQCHGWDGAGGLPMGKVTTANLTDDKWDHGETDGEIFYTIRHGVPPDLIMRPWDAFSDTEVWDIINYIRSLRQPTK